MRRGCAEQAQNGTETAGSRRRSPDLTRKKRGELAGCRVGLDSEATMAVDGRSMRRSRATEAGEASEVLDGNVGPDRILARALGPPELAPPVVARGGTALEVADIRQGP